MPQSSPWQALSRGEKGKLLTALNSWPFIVALGHQFSLGKKNKRVSKWRATGHINMWGIENKQFVFISLSCNHGENIWYVPVQLFPHSRRSVHIRKLIYFKYLKESDLKFNNKIKNKPWEGIYLCYETLILEFSSTNSLLVCKQEGLKYQN